MAYTRLLAILFWLLQSLALAPVLHAAFMDLNGRPVRAIESVSQSFHRVSPIMGVVVYQGVVLLIGLILLVIPSLILMTMWYVGLSVCVIEKRGARDSVNRSAALTKGYRWKIFGIIALVIFGGAIIEDVVDVIMTALTSQTVSTVANYGFQVIFLPFSAIVGVVVYHDLRVAKEGLGVERLSAVFD